MSLNSKWIAINVKYRIEKHTFHRLEMHPQLWKSLQKSSFKNGKCEFIYIINNNEV